MNQGSTNQVSGASPPSSSVMHQLKKQFSGNISGGFTHSPQETTQMMNQFAPHREDLHNHAEAGRVMDAKPIPVPRPVASGIGSGGGSGNIDHMAGGWENNCA